MSVDLLIKATQLQLEHWRSAISAIGFYQLLILACIFLVLRRLKQRQKRLVQQELNTPADHEQFITIRACDLQSYRPVNEEYDVPKVFPCELETYVRPPTHADLARWMLALNLETDTTRLLDIKRAITAAAAIHGMRIPKLLAYVDSRTKALWVRLGFDLELRSVDQYYVRNHASVIDDPSSLQLDESTLQEYQSELEFVGAMILRYTDLGSFPCFPTFVRILTEHHDLSKRQIFTSDAMQSLATVYAVHSGFPIPVSYIRCDQLTLQLLDA